MGRRGNIWTRSDRPGWFAWVDGKQMLLGHDRKEAERNYHAIKAAGRPLASSETRVAALVDKYLDWAAGRVRATTWRGYRIVLETWVDRYGHLMAVDVRPWHVTAWLEAHPSWRSPSTHRFNGAIVKIWSSWCRAQGYIDVDRLRGYRLPGIRLRDPAPTGDLERLIAAVTEPCFRDLLVVLYDTGARPGEIMSLDASRIDWRSSTAEVIGKRGKRVIGLTARALAALRRATNAQRTRNGVVLVAPSGEPWTRHAIRRRLDLAEKSANISRVTPYSFRHDYWARAHAAGVSDVLIAKQLGHVNLKMLISRYAHPDKSQLSFGAQQVAEYALAQAQAGATGNARSKRAPRKRKTVASRARQKARSKAGG